MENDNVIDPEDVNSAPARSPKNEAPDPNDEIPVPIAMSAAEIDERAQVIDALRQPNANSSDEELTP
jgi:hypothetical protein